MPQIRSFIAIELPVDIKAKLGSIENGLKSGIRCPAKWVSPESIHLTLKFLGNIDSGRVDEILSAMEKAAEGILPFNLRIEGTGAFPNPGRAQVVWVGLGGGIETLSRLQKSVEEKLAKLGYAAENRAFTPHLTLARVNQQAVPGERQELGRRITEIRIEPATFNVVEVGLIKSELARQGAIYSRLGSVRLKNTL